MKSAFIQELGMARNPQAAALLIDRVFEEGRPDQYKRELTRNALQAGAENILATAVHFPPTLDGTEYGIKAAFVDDGVGMTSNKIVDYIGELFNGNSVLGADGNFQMGARVSTLPFNRDGLIVASWTEEEPEGTLLAIYYDEQSKTYGVVSQTVHGREQETGIPPEWMRHLVINAAGHGTVFILMGSTVEDVTVGEVRRQPDGSFLYPVDRNRDHDTFFYNTKYWDLPTQTTLRVMLAPQDVEGWKQHLKPGEYFRTVKTISKGEDGGHTRLSYRTCPGLDAKLDQAEVRGVVPVMSPQGYKAKIHWALFAENKFNKLTPGGDPKAHGDTDWRDYDIPLGLFAEKFGDELYNVQSRGGATTSLEYYGISRRELRNRVAIVVEPDPPSAKFIGARPSSARDRLLIANSGLPHPLWGELFANNMPQPIRDRLKALNGETSKDEAERQRRMMERLRSFFGRYRVSEDPKATPVKREQVNNANKPAQPNPDKPDPKPGPRRRSPRPHLGFGSTATNEDTPDRGELVRSMKQRPIQVIWDGREEFEDRPGMVAHWIGAQRHLQMNGDHPLIVSLVSDEQSGRRADKKEAVADLVRGAIADHLVSTIQASELYVTSEFTGGQPFGKLFTDHVVSDETLTALVLNIATIEQLVRQRFKGRPGFRRAYEVADDAA